MTAFLAIMGSIINLGAVAPAAALALGGCFREVRGSNDCSMLVSWPLGDHGFNSKYYQQCCMRLRKCAVAVNILEVRWPQVLFMIVKFETFYRDTTCVRLVRLKKGSD